MFFVEEQELKQLLKTYPNLSLSQNIFKSLVTWNLTKLTWFEMKKSHKIYNNL